MKSWDWTHDRGLVWQLLRFSLTYTRKDLTKFAIFVNINVTVTLTSVRPDMTSSVSSSPLCPVSPGLLGDGGWLRTEGGRSRGCGGWCVAPDTHIHSAGEKFGNFSEVTISCNMIVENSINYWRKEIEILCYILCSLKIALEFSVVNYFSFISLQRAKTESLLASRKKHLFLNLFYSLKVFVGWCILAKDWRAVPHLPLLETNCQCYCNSGDCWDHPLAKMCNCKSIKRTKKSNREKLYFLSNYHFW